MKHPGETFDAAYDKAVEAVGRISVDRLERVLQVWRERDDHNDLVWAMKQILEHRLREARVQARYI